MAAIFQKKRIVFVPVLLSCFVYVLFRLYAGNTYEHQDEIITQKIIENIITTGHWDTNWALADLPEWFKSDQYNFSSYILTLTLTIKCLLPVFRIFKLNPDFLILLRQFSVFFNVITILLTYAVGKSLFNSRRIGLAAAWLTAVFPLLFQDSLYARPESFTTMLTLLLVLALIRQNQKRKMFGFLIVGGLIGFLTAAKITFLILLALPFIMEFGREKQKRLYYIKLTGALAAGLIIGFALGAPYALIHFSSYIHGVSSLISQYAGEHRPHGLPKGNIIERLAYSGKYFIAIGAGWFILAAISGWLLLLKERLYARFSAAGLFFAVIIYFSIKPVFFERNFSFAIPFLGMCAGFAIIWCIDHLRSENILRNLLSGLIILAVSVPLFLFMWKLDTKVLSGRYEKQRQELRTKLQNEYGAQTKSLGWKLDDFYRYKQPEILLFPDRQNTIYEVNGANDTYSCDFVAEACRRFGLRVIAELPCPFEADDLPPSTLYIYHSPHYFYLAGVERSGTN